MHVIAITGGNGFIGRFLVQELVKRGDIQVRILVRDQNETNASHPNITEIHGDLGSRESIEELLVTGCTVVHLAYDSDAPPEHNIRATTNLARLCRERTIRRFIHCSTVDVYGRAHEDVLDESMRCFPHTVYAKSKLEIEDVVRKESRDSFEYVILRPAAVFGPGGKSLLAMTNHLMHGSSIINYLRSCLFNERHLNLVSVANVVAAILFATDAQSKVDGETFIISQDHEANNNYASVERYLRANLLGEKECFPRVKIPLVFLKWVLISLGRDIVNPNYIYDSSKIRAAGYKEVETFEQGLDRYISSVRERTRY